MIKKEVALVFTLIMTGLWLSLVAHGIITIVIATAAVAIVVRRLSKNGDTGATLGLCPATILKPAGIVGVWILVASAAIIFFGLALNTKFWTRENIWKELFEHAFGTYLFSSVFQELLLHGYFTNNVGRVCKNDLKTALVIGILFAIIHIPNPILTVATFFGAGIQSYIFLRYSRNVYLLGLSHSILGSLIKYCLGVELIGRGCMRVGPGFWR